MSNPKKIEQWEIERYWEIFSSLLPPNTTSSTQYLTGAQAATVLKNSQLEEDRLAKVWDLADVDGDGNLDFEEFCVAMRVIFDLVNGEYNEVPTSLPDWLVPESKAHLVSATRALSGKYALERVPSVDSDSEPLKDGFDWYMSPSNTAKYAEIYNANRDSRGDITFASLEELYDGLDVPDTDIHSAWNLVNPSSRSGVGKDAALAFLHILNMRHEGFRIPRSVPPSLKASFERGKVDFRVDRQRERDQEPETTSGRKAKFGDTYLSRLGVGGKGSYSHSGTDFSDAKTTPEWEEVRLKKELAALETKIEDIEKRQKRKGEERRRENSKPALVKRELEQMLDYKQREKRKLDEGGYGDGGGGKAGGLDVVREEIGSVREQIEGLEKHWRAREEVLAGLKREIEELKG